MKEFLNKLNGWQRLFVAFLIFAYIPIAVVILSDIRYRDWQDINLVSYKMSNELRISLDKDETLLKPPNEAMNFYLNGGESYLMTTVGSVNDDWTYGIFVPKSLGPDKSRQYANEMDSLIKNHILKYKVKEGAILCLYFALGAMAIYLFGWTLGWIYRGFRK